jgi:phospholipid/cholesterol/gamma-HCH transport system substrate-binding protein
VTIRKETKIGFVVVLAIFLLYLGLNYLKGVYIFEKPRTFYGVYEKINGLEVSNPVMLNGFKIGQVREIGILNDGSGKLLVTLMISEEIDIPKNSRAQLKPGDLLGSMQLNILLGDSPGLAQSGDTLTSEISGDLFEEVNEQLRPFKIKARELITSVDSVLRVIEAILNAESQQNLVESFKGINNAIANLERTSFTIDTLITEERQRIQAIFSNIENLSRVLSENGDNLGNIIENFSSISDTLAQADVAGTIVKANAALANVDQIVQKINRGEGSLGMLINDSTLYNQLESAADNLDLLVEDMRVNPNRYVQFSVFGRKNKSIELTRKELEELKKYVNESE